MFKNVYKTAARIKSMTKRIRFVIYYKSCCRSKILSQLSIKQLRQDFVTISWPPSGCGCRLDDKQVRCWSTKPLCRSTKTTGCWSTTPLCWSTKTGCRFTKIKGQENGRREPERVCNHNLHNSLLTKLSKLTINMNNWINVTVLYVWYVSQSNVCAMYVLLSAFSAGNIVNVERDCVSTQTKNTDWVTDRQSLGAADCAWILHHWLLRSRLPSKSNTNGFASTHCPSVLCHCLGCDTVKPDKRRWLHIVKTKRQPHRIKKPRVMDPFHNSILSSGCLNGSTLTGR